MVTLFLWAILCTIYISQKSWETGPTKAAELKPSTNLPSHNPTAVLGINETQVVLLDRFRNKSAEKPEQVSDSSDLSNRDEIENEYTLNFDSEDKLAEFLKLAREMGVSILDQIDILNAVRIKVKDRDQFNELISRGPTPNDYASNYYIRTPGFPPPSDNTPQLVPTELKAFGNKALEWLGLEGDQQYSGENVVVAVLDTGIFNHTALNMNAIEQISLLDDVSTDNIDYNGHGTAVASIISGHSPDAPGVAPDAKILSVQVLDSDGVGDTFTVAMGIVEAVHRGADIINMSLGSYRNSAELRSAIEYADDNGVAVVASVGNDGVNTVTFPAAYPTVVAVTVVGPSGQRPGFANHGDQVDIAAPGTGVFAAWTDDQIIEFTGTSAAAPFVVGATALVMEKDPSLSPIEAVEKVIENSNDSGPPGPDALFGNGVLSGDRSLTWDEEGRYDISLASHYIEQTIQGELELTVSAQNRGTEPLSKIQLTSAIGGVVERIQFENVAVGETVSTTHKLDEDELAKAKELEVNSSVSITGIEDIKRDNNRKSSLIMYTRPPNLEN